MMEVLRRLDIVTDTYENRLVPAVGTKSNESIGTGRKDGALG